MKRRLSFALLLVIPLATGCPFAGSPEGEEDGGVVKREKDVSGKLAVALGGSDTGADEIVFDEDLTTLELENNDPDLFDLELKPKGARILPKKTGIGYVTLTVNGHQRSPIEITIPPQSLIQILLGEARGQLDREVTTEDDDETRVKASSVSVTGDAVAAVIRNRIQLIESEDQPSLFVVDAQDFGEDPPQSFYDAVIDANNGANNGTVYQFSPVDPDDPSFPVFQAAAERDSLAEANHIAYDQAVLTAAGIFTGDTEDPTGGAFAFYSPTEAQAGVLQDGLESGAAFLPSGCGTSDGNFPALAPVQILVLEEVRGFVFVRSRNPSEPAITNEP